MARRRRDPKRETFWREVLRRQAVGSVGVRAFCQQEKLTESAFHWWRRTIAQRDARSRAPKPPAFLPVVVDGQQPQDTITIELAGRRVLNLPGSMPASRLAEVVQALETAWADGGGER